MLKCVTCGAAATFTYFQRPKPELCDWCARSIPTEIYFLAGGISGIKEYIVLPHQVGGLIYEGTWNSSNWMTYPNLAERRNKVQAVLEIVVVNKEDHYPHKCPICNAPAYIGFASINCSKGCKQ